MPKGIPGEGIERPTVFNYDAVRLPEESYGACQNWRKCKQMEVQLGNGFCQKCYDRGLDRSFQGRERKKNLF